MKKRVFELQIGEVFWFSGYWRKVLRIDSEFLHYTSPEKKYKRNANDTIMKNSLMIVEIKNNDHTNSRTI
jgi:hypothetical protein